MNEQKAQIEINLVGWWAVMDGNKGEVGAVFSSRILAKSFIDKFYDYYPDNFFVIKQIKAKIDFTPEQIQTELTKRCAEIEQAGARINL